MKKQYEKPEIMFEDFSLSTNIAAGCELKTTVQGENQCGYPMREGTVFLSKETGCTYTPPQDSDGNYSYNGVCYHTPSDANNLFVS